MTTKRRTSSTESDELALRAPVLSPVDAGVLLRSAAAAPSLHNSQPWLFGVGERHVEVYADRTRQLAGTDAEGRSLLLSCGAALFNLRVAAAQRGFRTTTRVLPDPDDQDLVAILVLDERRHRPASLAAYQTALTARRTNRFPFADRRLSPDLVSRLEESAAIEGAVLSVSDDPAEVSRIVELLHDADVADRLDRVRARERKAWVGREGEDGFRPRPWDRDRHRVTRRSATCGRGSGTRRCARSRRPRPSPCSPPTTTGRVRHPLHGTGFPHMLLRLGYGTEVPATPRRPVDDVTIAARHALG